MIRTKQTKAPALGTAGAGLMVVGDHLMSNHSAPETTTDPWQGLRLETLADHHIDLLNARGISPAVATARGLWTAHTKVDLERLGFNRRQCLVPALVIPVYGPTGSLVTYYMRPDIPRILDGKARKYELPPESSICIDVPPGARAGLRNSSIPIYITEGPLKADAAVSHGLCCVALFGCLDVQAIWTVGRLG